MGKSKFMRTGVAFRLLRSGYGVSVDVRPGIAVEVFNWLSAADIVLQIPPKMRCESIEDHSAVSAQKQLGRHFRKYIFRGKAFFA